MSMHSSTTASPPAGPEQDAHPPSLVDPRLAERGWALPAPMGPAYSYQPVVCHGDVAFVSGHVPRTADGVLHPGKVGADVDLGAARAAAELATLNALASLKAAIGTLEAVRRIQKAVVFVASHPDFIEQPRVADAASDLLRHAFGAAGQHARSAIGVAVLPRNSAVEVELVVIIDPARATPVAGVMA